MTIMVNSTEQEQDALNKKKHTRSEYGAWLDTAIPLDGALIGAAPEIMQIVDDYFPVILNELKANKKLANISGKNGLARIKYACKVILFNLYLAYILGVPVRYSRKKAYYTAARRYGKLHFKFDRVIAIIDTFRNLGLIKGKIGKNSQTVRHRRQSRMWASAKLIEQFESKAPNPMPVYRAAREELIELRRKDKTPIDYEDTDEVNRLRANVEGYNKFIAAQQVELKVDGTVTTNVNKLKQLVGEVLKGNATVNNLTLDQVNTTPNNNVSTYTDSINNNDKNTTNNNSSILYKYNSSMHTLIPVQYNTHTSSINTSISGTILKLCDVDIISSQEELVRPNRNYYEAEQEITCRPCTPFHLIPYSGTPISKSKIDVKHPVRYLVSTVKNEFKKKKYNKFLLKTDIHLSDLNISNIHCRIHNTFLYRVFNNETFNDGGRFYGPTYQKLSSELRLGLLINEEPTVELDYSAHHIRMPYHLLGLDYRDDPYLALSDDQEERKIMKKLLLVAINADTEKKAIKGFRGAIWKDVDRSSGILKDKSVKKMLARAREVHSPIAGYIHSGQGRMLQNLDSRITERILMRMTDMAIPCLPVHDSYIVPQQYENRLRDAMMEEYKAVIGFEPVIG